MNSGSRQLVLKVSVGQFGETMTLHIGAGHVSKILPVLFVFLVSELATMSIMITP